MLFGAHLSRSIIRILTLGLVITGFATVVSAYTLVLRSGRQVEIPNDFVVNGSTLTYEIASGMQVSVQLAAIDINATDRANKEVAGSFSKRAARSISRANTLSTALDQSEIARQREGKRVITNNDLASYARRRIESEKAYNLTRHESGLPSIEQTRQQREEQASKAREELRKSIAEQQAIENYWRERASSLRAEMDDVEVQIQYLQNRLNQIPGPLVLGAAPVIFPVAGITTSTIAPSLRPQRLPRPMVFSAPRLGPQMGGGPNFGGTRFRGRVVFNQNPFHRGRDRGLPSFLPFAVVGGWPYQSYNYAYDALGILSQLDQLKLERARLQARWRELEDDARRAGAYPGWLRP